jgi:hypothetical protein
MASGEISLAMPQWRDYLPVRDSLLWQHWLEGEAERNLLRGTEGRWAVIKKDIQVDYNV